MNRTEDLKATLKDNLSCLRRFLPFVDIHIACFDESSECREWVNSEFNADIKTGLLKFHSLEPLPYWHFCWAKNAFKALIDSRYYSSLDGDNFLSEEEVSKTLSVIEEFGESAVIHHFSGIWGDGTSGRITIPTKHYRKYGYISELYPRQFDEIGLLLNLLTNEPGLTLVVRPSVNVIELSSACSTFCRLNALEISKEERDLGAYIAPLNPRGGGYATRDETIHAFQQINNNYSSLKLSTQERAKAHFAQKLKEAQGALVHDEIMQSLINVTFEGSALSRLKRSDAITVYAVMKNDFEFLKPWYSHYRSLGVERFIIVDDCSSRPIETELERPDVFVVRPRVGEFRFFKVFWIMALMKAFQEYGSWVLTVDADEFLDVPVCDEAVDPIGDLVRTLESSGRSFIPGVLVEMMPEDAQAEITAGNFIDTMSMAYRRPVNAKYGYQNLPPVKWAFGENWGLSFSLDLRWRLFGTHDCLRKIPIVRYERGITLNQGYHAIYRNGNELAVESFERILPIRHYKMYKLLSADFDVESYRSRLESYFSRTRTNLARMLSTDPYDVRRAWRLTPFKHRYERLVNAIGAELFRR